MGFDIDIFSSDRETEAAFMMFNFVESGIATIIFAVSDKVPLQAQLLVINIFLVACLACFLKLDLDIRFTDRYRRKTVDPSN